jgi:hypothetical protein
MVESRSDRFTKDVALEGGDIEIGAVEIKDETSDDRAMVTPANTARTATKKVLAVQEIDAAGLVAAIDATTAGRKVDIAGIKGTVTDVNSGDKSNGSQRVVIATDDINLAALKVSLEILDKIVQVSASLARVGETDPLNMQAELIPLLDGANIAAGTKYYPSSVGAATLPYKHISLTGKFVDADGTITGKFQVTNDEDRVSGDWHDISPSGYRADKNTLGEASITVTNGTEKYAVCYDVANWGFWRFEVINDGATNTQTVKGRGMSL